VVDGRATVYGLPGKQGKGVPLQANRHFDVLETYEVSSQVLFVLTFIVVFSTILLCGEDCR